jgi:hypothetical protein
MVPMEISAVQPAGLATIERAHGAMNAAYNALAGDRDAGMLPTDVRLAHDYISEARSELDVFAGHDAPDDAKASARAVLPRLQHALLLLDALSITPDPEHIAPLLDEIGFAMDHVESAMAGAGWD